MSARLDLKSLSDEDIKDHCRCYNPTMFYVQQSFERNFPNKYFYINEVKC